MALKKNALALDVADPAICLAITSYVVRETTSPGDTTLFKKQSRICYRHLDKALPQKSKSPNALMESSDLQTSCSRRSRMDALPRLTSP